MGGKWPTVQLVDFVEVITGFPFKSSLYSTDNEGVRLLRGDNVVQGAFRWEGVKLWSESEIINKHNNYWLKENDVILAMDRPWIEAGLKTSQITKNDLPCLLVQRVASLRAMKGLDQNYLRYLISGYWFVEYVKSVQTGTAVPHISPKQIKSFEFRLPSEEEQKQIGVILRSLDDKIELNHRTNTTLETMAQALFKSWFVDFDPVIDNALAAGNPIPESLHARAVTRKALGDKRKPLPEAIQKQFPSHFVCSEEMGWIPEGWKIVSIGEFCEVIDCLHSKKPTALEEDTGNILLQLSNIRDDGLLDLNKKYFISDDNYKKWISRIEVREGDCIITNVGRVGAVSIVPRGVLAAIGRNMTAIRLRGGNELKAFMITLLSSQYMGREIDRRTDVGTILNALNVKNIPLLRFLNAGQILETFENQAFPIMKKRQDLLEGNIVLSGLRDTLLPKLISGQLRILDAEKLVADVV